MAKSDIHYPMRTCISCGKKREKDKLIRLFLDKEGNLLVDVSGKQFGRGAYICDNTLCREKLKKNKNLNKRFRTDKVISISTELTE